MDVFFNDYPDNRAIEKLSELLEKANAFCDANPRVIKEAFLEEIRKYAERSGIE